MFLWDTIDNTLVGEYTDPETALKAVGAAMSLLGIEACKQRFTLTAKPKKSGKADVIMGPDALVKQGIVYYDKDVYAQRTRRKRGLR